MTIDPTKLALARNDTETIEQMRGAQHGATFVIHNMRALGYFQACAEIAERDDLVLIGLGAFSPASLYKPGPAQIVVDHFAQSIATTHQLSRIRAFNTRGAT